VILGMVHDRVYRIINNDMFITYVVPLCTINVKLHEIGTYG
jgi:hypothetical protein